MSEESKSELKEYAGGWITERKETGIPTFLKLAFPVISIAMIVYLFVYMNGEVNHPDRGPFVQHAEGQVRGVAFLPSHVLYRDAQAACHVAERDLLLSPGFAQPMQREGTLQADWD